jgi:uncharacterized membrane protein HdeD (DUF308 family)
MRKLSFWAKNHPSSARIVIVIAHILLIILGITLGNQFSRAGTQFSPLWIYFFILLFITISILYPFKETPRRTKWFYAKQKSCDFIAALCGFCLVFCLTNQLNQPDTLFGRANAVVSLKDPLYKNPAAEKILNDFKNGEKTVFSKKEKRIIKEEFKYQLKQYAKAKLTGNKERGDQVGLIILSCIAAVGLLFLLASLACTLSCNGSDAAAIIVFVIGTAAIIWGLIAVIRSIKRKSQKSQKNASADSK